MSTINSSWLAMQMADLLEAPLNTNSVVTAGVSRETLRRYVEAIQKHSSDDQNSPLDKDLRQEARPNLRSSR